MIDRWERLAAWAGTIRRKSTRGENAELFLRPKQKARTVAGRGKKAPLCDPGSE